MPDEPNVFEQKDLRISKAVVVGVAERVAMKIWEKYEIWDEKSIKEFNDIMSTITNSTQLDHLLAYIYAPMSKTTNDAITKRKQDDPPF